jgi:Skp family chaperone for outer membrane proteins
MKRASLILTFALGLVVARAFAEGTEPKAKPLLVGVVDIGLAFKNYSRKDDLEKEINAVKDGYQQEAEKEEAVLETKRRHLALLTPSSDKYRDLNQDVKETIALMKVRREGWEAKLKADVERLTLLVLDDIDAAANDYAKTNGFDLILKADSVGWGDERFQERLFREQVRSVIYREPSLDVTEAVTKLVNDRWEKSKNK